MATQNYSGKTTGIRRAIPSPGQVRARDGGRAGQAAAGRDRRHRRGRQADLRRARPVGEPARPLPHQPRRRPGDDFFALGGNSLLAAEMLAHARVMFGIGADWVRPLTRDLLRDPSLRGVRPGRRAGPRRAAASAGRGGRRDGRPRLRPVGGIRRWGWGEPTPFGTKMAVPGAGPAVARDLLLTGATGFLGAHLLADLLGGAADRIALPCAPRAARRLLAAEG